MKFKLLLFFFFLSLIISLMSCSYPQTTIITTENPIIKTTATEAEDIETTDEDGTEWLFFNYIVSVPDGVEISIAKAFLYEDKLDLTVNDMTIEQLKKQMPKDIPSEITDNGPFRFCTFTFDDGSEIIFQFTQSQ